MKQASTQNNSEPTKEAIAHHIVGPTKLHTKLFMLLDQLQLDMRIILLDAIKFQMIFESEVLKKVKSITSKYKYWYKYLAQELHVEAPNMAIMSLVP